MYIVNGSKLYRLVGKFISAESYEQGWVDSRFSYQEILQCKKKYIPVLIKCW